MVVTADQELDMRLYKSRYVWARVGGTGREVLLRLRFDTSEIVLYSNMGVTPSACGHTYDPLDSTELFYFPGFPRALRLRMRYASYGDGSVPDPEDTSERVSHQGVLGVKMEASSLRNTFDGWTLSRTHFLLGRAIENEPITGGDVRLAPELDYTLISNPEMYYDLFSKAGQVVPVCASASVWVTPLGLDAQDAQIDLVQFDPTADAQIVVGFEHMQPLVVSNVTSDSKPTRAAASAVGPLASVDRSDYLWAFAGVLLSALLWHPGLSHRLFRARRTWPKERAEALRQESWPVLARGSSLCILLGLYVACLGVETWRQAREQASPYGDASTAVSDVAYWTLAAYALAVAVLDLALNDSRRASYARVFHRSAASYAVCWMLLLAQFDEGINGILMVIFAAMIALRACDAWMYDLKRWWLHAPVLLLSSWFFAYHQFASYIQERWPSHPSAWIIETLTLVVILSLGSISPFFGERSSFWAAISKKLYTTTNSKSRPTTNTVVVRPSPVYVMTTQTGAVSPINFAQ